MKAIILAAGIGRRLGKVSAGRPKCLLQFRNKSLLQRHVENLNNHGVDRIIIVAGYRHGQIEAALENIISQAPIKTIINPDYKMGSVMSLHCAQDHLTDGTDTLLMDADVLYDPEILAWLFNTEFKNCFLLDRDFEPGDEPVKLCVANNTLIEFRKKTGENSACDYQGESVGFFRFDSNVSARLAGRTQEYIDNGRLDEPYEEAIRDLLIKTPDLFNFEDVTGRAWIEIDFPGDVVRAEKEISVLINGAAS